MLPVYQLIGRILYNTYAEMVYTNRFDENSDLSTTYFGPDKNDKEHENQG